ncbi:DUF6282 family protein [Bacilliculturomica massiliensis]|uniref:DUF6282 family protein n=1 Tax=Bacilliculturomica massiliensis TaxID=1917867 RepID=UPI001031BA8B|nr:DUF6282 family protein [Bacilliculturomica massiliensis]
MLTDKQILDGLIDLHIHAGPSVMPREVDAAEMLREAEEAGYRAFVVKDHFAPTVMTADVLQKHMATGKTQVFGGIALNNSVGGLNVKALDAAYAMGAKIFWMPTVSTDNHIKAHTGTGVKFPSSKGMTVKERAMTYIDADGQLAPEALEVLEYAAKKEDLIMGTGHGSLAEVDAAICKAAELGVTRILVNHPFYMIGADLTHMKKWAELGAYIELNATVFVPESKFCSTPMSVAKEILENIPKERVVIDSDYGQNGNGSVSGGLLRFIRMLIDECGLSDGDVELMAKRNPAKLLGLE